MSSLIPISALIGDRTYRIKIEPADEEVVRHTLRTINEKILEFKTEFAGKDMQDYVAMVLLWYATNQTGQGTAALEKRQLSEALLQLEKILDTNGTAGH